MSKETDLNWKDLSREMSALTNHLKSVYNGEKRITNSQLKIDKDSFNKLSKFIKFQT